MTDELEHSESVVEVDEDGEWSVITFESGVRARSLMKPTQAWYDRQPKEHLEPPTLSLEERVAALEARLNG